MGEWAAQVGGGGGGGEGTPRERVERENYCSEVFTGRQDF